MRLDKLTLWNFRGFENITVSFDPAWTVLVGGNMAGKSALLDGAVAGLAVLLENVEGAPRRDIGDLDVRRTTRIIGGVPDLQAQVQVLVDVEAVTGLLDEPLRWQLVRDGEHTRLQDRGNLAQLLLKHTLDSPRVIGIPVIAHYGTNRVWQPETQPDDIRGIGSRSNGYVGCFDVASTQSTLAGWIRKQTLVQLQRGGGYRQPQLAAVESAIGVCIDDIERFWFDVQFDQIRWSRKGGETQLFSMLSEGYRNVVAMVADIAWRAAVLNPQHGDQAHLLTEGVVLIDELDLHLHPAWQRRIVGDLQRTFPRVQFIVTTHSPQIVASVRRDQIRVLENNRLLHLDVHVEGRDSNGLLEDIFGVPARPTDAQAEIDEVFRLLDREEFDEARAKLASLRERLGPDDEAIVRADWVLDTEAPLATG